MRLILLTIVAFTVCNSIFVTPVYPPNAIQGQFYTVSFRIRGVDYPIFKFTGLPQGLSQDSNGTVYGTPLEIGSFSVKLSYTSGNNQGDHEFILRVLQNTKVKSSIVSATPTSVGLVISFPDNLIFKIGQKITIKLKASQGVEPYLWAFLNLPEGLVSNEKTGELQGYLKQAGYYNLNIQVADKEGKSASGFLTIKAQSTASLQTEQTLQVEIKNTKTQANLVAIEKQQVDADKNLNTILKLVDQGKNKVNEKKKVLALETVRLQNANNSFNAAQQALNQAGQVKGVFNSELTSLLNSVNVVQKNLGLASIEANSAAKAANDSVSAFELAEKRFNSAELVESDAEKKYVEAKKKFSDAEATLRDAFTAKNFAFGEYLKAAEELETNKGLLEDAKTRKLAADLAVQDAKDALETAFEANSMAENQLTKSEDLLEKAQRVLSEALAKVADLRQKYAVAKNQLEAQQWDYELRINQLYTAQARKQAADRLSAIALAEGSLSDHNEALGVNIIGTQTSLSQAISFQKPRTFVGCGSSTYPSITGTSQIKQVNLKGYFLASGHQLIWGSCSQVDKVTVGDWVSYNGAIVDRVVNAARIQRVLLS